MSKHLQILILLVLCCLGCDTALKQQQAEEARRAATANELRQLGQALHEKQNSESSPDHVANDAPESPADSNGPSSGQSATPDHPDTLGDSGSPQAPTE